MKTILVIDDQASVLKTTSWLLQTRGYRCVTAERGEEAEQRFREEVVDLVIVDHGLPDRSGFEVARMLKAIRAVPVLMLTGDSELHSGAGAVDLVLTKPQDPKDLLNAVANLAGAA